MNASCDLLQGDLKTHSLGIVLILDNQKGGKNEKL